MSEAKAKGSRLTAKRCKERFRGEGSDICGSNYTAVCICQTYWILYFKLVILLCRKYTSRKWNKDWLSWNHLKSFPPFFPSCFLTFPFPCFIFPMYFTGVGGEHHFALLGERIVAEVAEHLQKPSVKRSFLLLNRKQKKESIHSNMIQFDRKL